MRRWMAPAWMVTVIMVLTALRVAADAPPSVTFTGEVVGISDGDTLSVLRDGKAVKVRLYGIDAPEKAQPFGARARQYTAELAFRQSVRVRIIETDRYGRLISEVRLPDNRLLHQVLVEAGMAWWYAPYAKRDVTLAQFEATAKATRQGLWADEAPIPPWQWRKGCRGAVVASPQRKKGVE